MAGERAYTTTIARAAGHTYGIKFPNFISWNQRQPPPEIDWRFWWKFCTWIDQHVNRAWNRFNRREFKEIGGEVVLDAKINKGDSNMRPDFSWCSVVFSKVSILSLTVVALGTAVFPTSAQAASPKQIKTTKTIKYGNRYLTLLLTRDDIFSPFQTSDK